MTALKHSQLVVHQSGFSEISHLPTGAVLPAGYIQKKDAPPRIPFTVQSVRAATTLAMVVVQSRCARFTCFLAPCRGSNSHCRFPRQLTAYRLNITEDYSQCLRHCSLRRIISIMCKSMGYLFPIYLHVKSGLNFGIDRALRPTALRCRSHRPNSNQSRIRSDQAGSPG